MAKNEVATQGETAVDVFGGGLDFSGFQREDNEASGLEELLVYTKLPFAKFYAKTHKGVKGGSIVLYSGTDKEEVINLKEEGHRLSSGVQIVNIAYQRVMFESEWSAKSESNTPDCKSYDNVHGAEGMKFAGRKCATCPMQDWNAARAEGGPSATPPCKQTIMLLIRVPGEPEPFHLQVKGINIKPFNEFGSAFKKVVDKNKTYAFAFNLGMSSKLIEHANGENEVFTFHSVKGQPLVSQDDFEKGKEILAWYKEDYIAMMREASLAHEVERSAEAGSEEGADTNAPF